MQYFPLLRVLRIANREQTALSSGRLSGACPIAAAALQVSHGVLNPMTAFVERS